jgi:hypothetical protein
MTLKSWDDFERQRLALQQFSKKFSRAELCRRAGIDSTTFLKGLKEGSEPRPSKGSAVRREIEAEVRRLTDDQRRQLELVLAAETAMVDAGLR